MVVLIELSRPSAAYRNAPWHYHNRTPSLLMFKNMLNFAASSALTQFTSSV